MTGSSNGLMGYSCDGDGDSGGGGEREGKKCRDRRTCKYKV